jgi:Peptidase A4 family
MPPSACKTIEAARKVETMRRSLTMLAGGTAALTLALPVSAAYASPASAHKVKVPKAANSRYVAGYAQVGCGSKGYPQYVQILGNITVPKATDAGGTPGNSADYYTLRPGRNPNSASKGVAAGVAVLTDAGTSYIYAYGLWYGLPIARASFPVQAGNKLQVEIQNQGSGNWRVEITDETTDQQWSQTNPDSAMPKNACAAGAFESSSYPVYDVLTKTKPVTFSFSRVLWGQKGQRMASVSKLLGKLPAHAKLVRYNLVNTHGHMIAGTSKPTDNDNNFTVTDK